MKIKLLINGTVNYYFCGSISLKRSIHDSTPLEIDLDSLNDQEIVGLARALRSGVINVVEGEVALLEKASYILADTKLGKKLNLVASLADAVPVEEKVETEEVIVETTPEVTEEDVKEETTEEPVAETPAKKTTTRTKKTTSK